jgi:hypothetical protein
MTAHPPKPRLALSIGVVGHRLNRLTEQKRSEVTACIRKVLDQLSHAAQAALERHRAFFAAESATVTLISGLAEGADRMAAWCDRARSSTHCNSTVCGRFLRTGLQGAVVTGRVPRANKQSHQNA